MFENQNLKEKYRESPTKQSSRSLFTEFTLGFAIIHKRIQARMSGKSRSDQKGNQLLGLVISFAVINVCIQRPCT